MEKMRDIPDQSIDLILTDPPYGTTPCEWDKALPLKDLWTHLNRIIKPKGVIAMFGIEPFSSALRLSNIESYKYDWFWKKPKSLGANFAHSKNSPIKVVENICIFSRAKILHAGRGENRMAYNPQGLVKFDKIIKERMPSKIDSFRKNVERPSHREHIQEFTNYPGNVIEMDFSTDERKKRYHPTQKPLNLLEFLVKTYTHEGDTVLDFTMGSGSTGVACLNTGRKFIGIEKDDGYYRISQERLAR